MRPAASTSASGEKGESCWGSGGRQGMAASADMSQVAQARVNGRRGEARRPSVVLVGPTMPAPMCGSPGRDASNAFERACLSDGRLTDARRG